MQYTTICKMIHGISQLKNEMHAVGVEEVAWKCGTHISQGERSPYEEGMAPCQCLLELPNDVPEALSLQEDGGSQPASFPLDPCAYSCRMLGRQDRLTT